MKSQTLLIPSYLGASVVDSESQCYLNSCPILLNQQLPAKSRFPLADAEEIKLR